MGHLLVVAKQRWLGQECRNTFYFGGNDAVMSNAQAIVDGMRGAWTSGISAILSQNWQLYACDVYDKTIPSVPGVEFTFTSGALVGGNSVDDLVTQAAGLVTFKAPVSPPNTNRKYIAGFTESATSAGLFTSTIVTHMLNWGNAILALPTTLSLAIAFEVVILLPDGTVSGGNPLVTCLPRQVPATMRSRRIGVGA